MAFFQDHLGEPVPEENFWTSWCKGRLTEADTPTIRLGATPSGLTIAHLQHSPHMFYRPDGGCPSCCPTNSVEALKAKAKPIWILIKQEMMGCHYPTTRFIQAGCSS